MTEYIKREDALAVFCDFCGVCDEGKREPLECYDILGKVLERLPAEDVRPVVYAASVRFYDDPFTGRLFTTCSRCDQKVSQKDAYCRHCGASFLREDEDDG